MSLRQSITCLFVACLLAEVFALPALATYPPFPGMLERMEREGTLDAAKEFAKQLGNHQMKEPKRGALPLEDYSNSELADLIRQNFGRNLDGEHSTSSIGRSTSTQLDWVQLDLNRDRVVDERDLLALGLPRPKTSAGLPSLGTNYMPVLLIEFPDYPHYISSESFYETLFGEEGDGETWFRGLRYFYEKSSHGQLILDGDVLGWYMAKHPRTYYHPDDSNSYPESGGRQSDLLTEAVMHFEESGTDFSKFDNDKDGFVDQLTVVWTGPHGDWATFWWGYQTWWGDSPTLDGVRFGSYSWQWERGYYFGSTPPEPEFWDTGVVIHETGHALGIPDYYDYDGSVGPQGGVGGMDIMGGWSGEHCSYSKFVLGWLNPVVASGNLQDELLQHGTRAPDSVFFMPGYDPVSPWTEFFVAESRFRETIDQTLPNDGMVIWHVDATVNEGGGTIFNNSYTPHKLLRLMEADGLEEIENGIAGANAGDFYLPGMSFGPETMPSSDGYNGPTGMTVDDIQAFDGAMSADFTLFASNPPSISLDAPEPGETLSGIVPVVINVTDDNTLTKVQFLTDGALLAQWESGGESYNYDWNTMPEFNRSMLIEARAYDDDGQMSSDSFVVTVDNSGLPLFSDTFEAGLGNWRAINIPETMRGHYTRWALRESPSDPWPPGVPTEAYVQATGADDAWHGANDRLRSPRINTSSYEQALHLRFFYRCREGFALYSTRDEGQSWELVETLTPTWGWAEFNRGLEYQGGHVYFELRYSGSVHKQDNNSWGANIDGFSAAEAVSAPPTVAFTSHSNGDKVSGAAIFSADATDDTGIAQVDFYLNNGMVFSDTEAPYQYERYTPDDDDHPRIRLKAVSQDLDGIRSLPVEITLAWDNPRPFPLYEDAESGTLDNWSLQNDERRPNWELSSATGKLGNYSMNWFGAGLYEQDNSDGLWYLGQAGAEGRQCVDLANLDCVSPVLRFKYKGDVAPGIWGVVYLYTDWDGWRWVGDWLSDNNRDSGGEWVDVELSLERHIGHSGRLVWWTWSGDNTDGTEMWIDEVEVVNDYIRTPEILTVVSGLQSTEITTITGRYFQGPTGRVLLDGNELDIVSWEKGQVEAVLEGTAGEHLLVVEARLGQQSAAFPITIGEPLSVELSGLDSAAFYLSEDSPAIGVSTNADAERVELYVDDNLVATSSTAPFADLLLPVAGLRNGDHIVQLRAYRRSVMAESNTLLLRAFTLRGDVNGDGLVDGLDASALPLYLGLASGEDDFRPWYDCDEDGTVTEMDQAYIGYFGTFGL